MFAISNNELDALPAIGDYVDCKLCGGKHKVEFGKNLDGTENKILSFYECGDKTYLAAIKGKAIK